MPDARQGQAASQATVSPPVPILEDTPDRRAWLRRAPRPFWLPRKVAVTVEWEHRIYRTRHSYSDYKLFSDETREDKKEIVSPPNKIPQ